MYSVFIFSMPGGMEVIIIALFILIFFGAKKIPEIARGFGKGIREFKTASKEIKEELEDASSTTKTKKTGSS